MSSLVSERAMVVSVFVSGDKIHDSPSVFPKLNDFGACSTINHFHQEFPGDFCCFSTKND